MKKGHIVANSKKILCCETNKARADDDEGAAAGPVLDQWFALADGGEGPLAGIDDNALSPIFAEVMDCIDRDDNQAAVDGLKRLFGAWAD